VRAERSPERARSARRLRRDAPILVWISLRSSNASAVSTAGVLGDEPGAALVLDAEGVGALTPPLVRSNCERREGDPQCGDHDVVERGV
jgi:hypothetical protein